MASPGRESAARYLARQADRLAAYEDRLRRDLILEERAVRHAQLVPAVEEWRAAAAAVAVAPAEHGRRAALMEAEALELEAIADVGRNVAFATALLPREIAGRRRNAEEEAVERARLRATVRAQSVAAALSDVEAQEAAWRTELVRAAAHEATPLWRALTAQQLRFLVTPAGSHSEPHYRAFIELQERRARRDLARVFCQCNVMWLEEWRRATLVHSARIMHGYLRAHLEVSREEAAAREELRLVQEPLTQDILEELEYRRERTGRRDAKLAALRALRRAEMDRLVTRRATGGDEVDWWKARELDAVAEEHAAMLADLVAFSPGGAADGGPGESGSPHARTAARLEAKLEQLAQPTTPFREIVAYRKSLRGFGTFVSAVEAAVGTPQALRTRDDHAGDVPLLEAAASPGEDAARRRLGWSSRQRQRYRVLDGDERHAAITDAGSPYHLDSYDALKPADSRSAAQASSPPPRALVPVVAERPSAQKRIADEIRCALEAERKADLHAGGRGVDQLLLAAAGGDGPTLAIQDRHRSASREASDSADATLEAAMRRRADAEEMAEMERHTAALDALHQHLLSFI